MPRKLFTQDFSCPNCGLQVKLSKNTARVSKKKSAKRVANGKRNFAEGRVILVDGKFARGPNAGTPTSSKRSRKGKEPAEGPVRSRRRVF